MKGKMKKIIAGIATLAMAAQLAFVLPASAAGEYYTQNFEQETAKGTDKGLSGDKQEDTLTLADGNKWASKYGAGFMSIAKYSANSDINMYYQFAMSSASGGRSALCNFGDNAKKLDDEQRSVFEMDFFMSEKSGTNQIVLENPNVYGTTKTNGLFTGNYAVALCMTANDKVGVQTLDGENAPAELTGYTGGTWAHLKAVMNFKEDTVVIKVTSLDNKTTYLEENKFAMAGDNSFANTLVTYCGRDNGGKIGIDNVVFRPYADGDIVGTYYMATFNVDGKTYSKSADKTTGLIDSVPDTTKTGYLLKGWMKDDDEATLYTAEQILATKLTANVTYTAVYEKDAAYIEPLASLEFSKFPTGGLPTMGADADTFADNEIQVKLVGELDTDLLANPDSRVTDLKIDWEFDGFRYIASKKGATTDAADSNEYCDSYAKVEYSTTDPSLVNFKLKKENFNFYGKVTAKVHYNGKDMEITKAMSIIPDKTIASGVILPKAGYGYIQDFSLLEDSMVGYQATTSADNKSATDIVTGDWAAYGGNNGRGLYVAKDEDVDGKFLKLKATGTNSSTFAVNKISEAPTGQVIIEQDVRFYNTNTSILLKTDNPVTWSDNATTFSLNFTGSAMNINGNAICAATTGVWYHIVLSADVTSKLCYAQVYDMEGNLLGKSDTVPFTNVGSTEPTYLCYRTPDNSQGEFDFNNVTMYVPEIAGDIVTTTSNDTLIIPSDEIDDGISYKSNTVTVKDDDAADGTKAVAIAAVYNSDKLVSAKTYPLTFADGIATSPVSIVNNTRLMVWNSLEDMEPLYTPITVSDASVGDTVSATLTATALSTDGYDIIGKAEWSVADAATGEASEYVTIEADKDNSHNATLTVAKGAASGEYSVTVKLGGKQKTITITATGNQESVKFTTATSSIAIPLEDGASENYTYAAAVVDKNSNPVEGKTVTYAMYDKNNANELTTPPTGISFNKETGVLTVSAGAQATTVYIRAAGTNSADEAISTSLKVTIHGLAFDFGAADGVVEGYTLVASNTAYTEATGYGIVSGSPTAGGTTSLEDADADNLTGTFKFQAKVEPKKVYNVTINYSGSLASEAVNADMTGVARTNETKGAVTYEVPVIDDILDLSFTSSTVSSIVIEKLPDKQKGGKPNIFTVGDSTAANHGSWGYQLSRDLAKYDLASIATLSNNGQGSQNLGSYYNNGALTDRVLTKVKPGDYVTIGNMGTNGMGTKFEETYNYYVDACIAMGAKVIINSYSPHGAVGDYANCYNSETHTFEGYRKDAYDNIVRAVYAERSNAEGDKYDPNVVGFVDIGKMADAAFNAYVADYAANGYDTADAAAQAIITCFSDHNHYGPSGKPELAGTLMIEGYKKISDEIPGADGIAKTLYDIVSADLAKAND